MKLHEFAGIVFVQALRHALLDLLDLLLRYLRTTSTGVLSSSFQALRAVNGELRVWADAVPVVEIPEHRRTFGGSNQEILKLAHGMRTNNVALIGGGEIAVRSFVDKYVEVVKPEIGHHFFELALAIGRTQNFAL